ncbi:MAG TPA: GNAT family N-acetyltransferase [Noviherbaspirillum sp.]|nr:GNAT family N-acetyltransferase [Noviherbaspirillum sp.]
MRIVVGDWETLRADAQPVRYDVFVQEQKVPLEMEWDEMDPLCRHAVAYGDEGKAIATGRLLPDGHIGRMAVRAEKRGQGIGGTILRALMDEAKRRGDKAVMLNAQIHAEPFYTRFGFVREGQEFMEAGIPHIAMRHEFA